MYIRCFSLVCLEVLSYVLVRVYFMMYLMLVFMTRFAVMGGIYYAHKLRTGSCKREQIDIPMYTGIM